MSEPFIAQIKMFAGNFAPRGFMFCNGAILSIAQNTALFSLVGTTYGGDGRTTFGIPNLEGRFAIGQGNGPGLSPRSWGQLGGAERVTLNINQLPNHTHDLRGAAADASRHEVAGNTPGATRSAPYSSETRNAPGGGMIATAGGGQSHENMPPYIVLNYIIAIQGIYPSRS